MGKSYEKIIWTCSRHVKDKNFCTMKAIREDEIQNAFLTMWNKLYTNYGVILEPLLAELKQLPKGIKEAEQNEQLDKEIQNLTEQCRILNQVMKKGYLDTALFIENQNILTRRLTECRRKKALLLAKQRHRREITETEQLIALLKSQDDLLKEFREDLFDLMVKEIRISPKHDIVFCLRNGLELTEENEEEGRQETCSGTCQSATL